MNKINDLTEPLQNDDYISDFYLITCEKQKDGRLKCTEVINLPRDNYPLSIDLNGAICFIGDKDGNIIYNLSKNTSNNKFKIEKYTVDYIDKGNMIISSIKNTNEEVYQMDYIHFIKNNTQIRNIFDRRKGSTLERFEIPNQNYKTAIIKRKNNMTGFHDTRLFAIDKGKFISPILSDIHKIKESDDILRFDDKVFSNKELDHKRFSTTLIGYITLDGVMGSKVYDTEINAIRDVSTKDGHIMEGYKIFRDKVKNELDYKFEEQRQIENRKKKFQTKALSILKNRKIRNNYED